MSKSVPHQVVEIIRQTCDLVPKVGIVCGSGLGQLAECLSDVMCFDYSNLPGFPVCSVDGHAGRLTIGTLQGVTVACLQGRSHFYEGLPREKMTTPIRTLRLLGCESIILTNAAGSLNTEVAPGQLSLVKDHINLQFNHPLLGPNDEEFGPRFVAMDDAYNPEWRAQAKQVADKLGLPLAEGIYVGVSGPTFETPAEIEAFRRLGADLVGMSTVADVIISRHCGLKVLTISVVTNLAAGMHHQALSHVETLSTAKKASNDLIKLVRAVIAEYE